ncbi:MAG: glycine betaine ABC transporter substrate-binding protein [Catonella sp.]
MKKFIYKLVAAFVVVTMLTGCTADGDKKTVRVGSKDFTENLIIAEVYALALEDARFKVERVPRIAGSVIHTSIINNEIDLYPEYTGTGLLSILKLPMESDPVVVYNTVKKEYNDRFNLTWLDYSSANDSQGLVIKTSKADELGIKTISDLQSKASEIRFASQGTFDEREDGIAGLEKVYGKFDWKSHKVYDNSLKYQVLKSDEADVTPAYTTEGQLVNKDEFKVLTDDKQFWPPYNPAPVIKNDILEKNPEIAEILNSITKELTTETVVNLNSQVDVDGKEYEVVAKEFYQGIKK